MALPPGTRFGSYEIVVPLGAGGMGEVYRARDTKLGREVALKVLPEAFASDPDRLTRFQREARTLATLNHSHIAQIFGFEQANGTSAFVMELVEGEDLSQRIARGSIPVEEALAIARQIGEALDAAHERGIVHRDLKPANIKITPQGIVKVLDFGIAKSVASPDATSLEENVTITADVTRPGIVIGTAAYMSPEQARGENVDKRTDIWAFGCVLYELLTGRGAFRGPTISDTLRAVTSSEPDWAALPASTPEPVRRVLHRCLAKDTRSRIRDIGDVRLELEASRQVQDATPPSRTATALPALVVWLLVTAGAAGTIGGLAMWLRDPAAERFTTRLVIPLAPVDTFGPPPAFALSPDGQRMVLALTRAGNRSLFVRELSSFDLVALPGTEGAQQPFFSPDGRSVGFFAAAKLKRVAISGGAPVSLADAVSPRGGSWGTNNTIVFAPTPASGLLQVAANGGAVRSVTTLDRARGEGGHRWPEFLPDGHTVLFAAGPATTHTSWSEARIALVGLNTGRRLELVPRGTHPKYLEGFLFYIDTGDLLMREFDPKHPELAGESVVVVKQVAQGGYGAAQVALSSSGSFAYTSGTPPSPGSLVWMDHTGVEEPLPMPPKRYSAPRLSPDGQRLAVTISTANSDVWVYDLDRGTGTLLTHEGGNLGPIWTPDGERVTFSSNRYGSSNVFWKRADGSGVDEQLTTGDSIQIGTSWSPRGDVLLLMTVNAASSTDVDALHRVTGQISAVLQGPFAEERPMFSPDGRHVAFVTNETGREEVYVRAFPDGGRRWPISNDGGTDPVWARSGKELFYLHGNDMMAVNFQSEPELTVGKPRKLFTGTFARSVVAGYDVDVEGKRLLMVKATDPGDVREVRVVLNWVEELRRQFRDGNSNLR